MRNAAVTAVSHSAGFIHFKHITEYLFGQRKVLTEKETKWWLWGRLRLVVINQQEDQTRDVEHFVVWLINLKLLMWHKSYITNNSVQFHSDHNIPQNVSLDIVLLLFFVLMLFKITKSSMSAYLKKIFLHIYTWHTEIFYMNLTCLTAKQ